MRANQTPGKGHTVRAKSYSDGGPPSVASGLDSCLNEGRATAMLRFVCRQASRNTQVLSASWHATSLDCKAPPDCLHSCLQASSRLQAVENLRSSWYVC